MNIFSKTLLSISEKVESLSTPAPTSAKALAMRQDEQIENAVQWISNQVNSIEADPVSSFDTAFKALPESLKHDPEFAHFLLHKDMGIRGPSNDEIVSKFEASVFKEPGFVAYDLAMDPDGIEALLEARSIAQHTAAPEPKDEYDHYATALAIEHAQSLSKPAAMDFLGATYFDADAPLTDFQGLDLRAFNPDYLSDKEFVVFLAKNGAPLDRIPESVRNDEEIMKACLDVSTESFRYASAALKNDPDFAEHAFSVREQQEETFDHWDTKGDIYEFAGADIKRVPYNFERSLALKTGDKALMQHAPDNIKDDKALVAQATQADSNNLAHASRRLRKDGEFIRSMASQFRLNTKHVPDSFLEDKNLALSLREHRSVAFKRLPEKFTQEPEFMKKLLVSMPDDLALAGREIRSNKEVVEHVISSGKPEAYQHADATLRADKDLALMAVKADGSNLQHVDPVLKADSIVASEAIKADPQAIRFLENPSVALMTLAVNQPGNSALQYASAELKADRAFVDVAITNNGLNLQHASAELRADFDFVMKACKTNEEAIFFASERILEAAYERQPSLRPDPAFDNYQLKASAIVEDIKLAKLEKELGAERDLIAQSLSVAPEPKLGPNGKRGLDIDVKGKIAQQSADAPGPKNGLEEPKQKIKL